jgi:hypothetical protein
LEVLVALQAASIGLFWFAGSRAGLAMDKGGLGDVRLWAYWDAVSGSAFGLMVALWLVSWVSMHLSARPIAGLFWLLIGVPSAFVAMFVLCLMV